MDASLSICTAPAWPVPSLELVGELGGTNMDASLRVKNNLSLASMQPGACRAWGMGGASMEPSLRVGGPGQDAW